jgi:hypothetical protein
MFIHVPGAQVFNGRCRPAFFSPLPGAAALRCRVRACSYRAQELFGSGAGLLSRHWAVAAEFCLDLPAVGEPALDEIRPRAAIADAQPKPVSCSSQ